MVVTCGKDIDHTRRVVRRGHVQRSAGYRACSGSGTREDVIKALRWLGASLLGLVGGLLGLVGAVLCVTIILAPLGIPILFLARRLFKSAGQLVVPRKVRHPVEALADAASSSADDLHKSARKRGKAVRKQGKKARKQGKKATRTAAKKVRRA
jgi:hypothetical protein